MNEVLKASLGLVNFNVIYFFDSLLQYSSIDIFSIFITPASWKEAMV